MEWSALEPGVTEVRALDADGEPLDMIWMRGNSWGPRPFVTVIGELSEVFMIPDQTAWLQVTQEGEEIDRVAVRPVPGEIVRVEL